MKSNPLTVEFHGNMVRFVLNKARRQLPAQIRVSEQKLPEMECQLAIVANDYTFTGIEWFHLLVKLIHFSEKTRDFSLKRIVFTGR